MFSNVTGSALFLPRMACTAPSRIPVTVTDFRPGASSIVTGAVRVGNASDTNRDSTSQGPPRTPEMISSMARRCPASARSDTMITCFQPPSTMT